MFRITSFYLIIISIILSYNLAFSTEFTLHYDILLGSVKLGESTIQLRNNSYEARAKTVGPGDLIYPYSAKWITYIEKNGYPQKSIIISKDRFKQREKHIIFNSNNLKVIVEKIQPKRSSQSYDIPFPVYDELSAFVASWHLDYLKNGNFELPLYIDGERHQVKIKLKGKISCNFNNQTKTCLEIGVILPEKSELLRRSREVTLILLQEERFPIEIRGKLPLFGSLKAKLRSLSVNSEVSERSP